jgi:hypothetical protein
MDVCNVPLGRPADAGCRNPACSPGFLAGEGVEEGPRGLEAWFGSALEVGKRLTGAGRGCRRWRPLERLLRRSRRPAGGSRGPVGVLGGGNYACVLGMVADGFERGARQRASMENDGVRRWLSPKRAGGERPAL